MQVEFYFVPSFVLRVNILHSHTHLLMNTFFTKAYSLFSLFQFLSHILFLFYIICSILSLLLAASLSESARCFLFLDSFEECKSYFFVICGDSSDVVFVVRMGFWVQEERPWRPSGILITSYQKAYSITIVYDCWPWC